MNNRWVAEAVLATDKAIYFTTEEHLRIAAAFTFGLMVAKVNPELSSAMVDALSPGVETVSPILGEVESFVEAVERDRANPEFA